MSLRESQLTFEGDFHEAPVEQICQSISNRLLFKKCAEAQAGNKHRRQFNESLQHSLMNIELRRIACRRASDIEESQSLPVCRQRQAKIMFRRITDEMFTVCLRLSWPAPPWMTAAQPAAGAKRDAIEDLHLAIRGCADLKYFPRMISNEQRDLGRRQKLRYMANDGAVCLRESRAQLQFFAQTGHSCGFRRP